MLAVGQTSTREPREEGGKGGRKQGNGGSTEEVRAGEGGWGAAPGGVDTSRGQQWGRSTPCHQRRRGGGDAGLAFTCTLTGKLAWLQVGHLIKGLQSEQAVREGLHCQCIHAYGLHMAMVFSNEHRSIGSSSERSDTPAFRVLIAR